MQIVIDIDEETYKHIMADSGVYVLDEILVENAIYNGTPLPKGHGKIIDADTIHIVDEKFYTKSDYYEAIGAINDAPTIIEADKGE